MHIYGTELLVTEVFLFMYKFNSSAYGFYGFQKLHYMAVQLPLTVLYISIPK